MFKEKRSLGFNEHFLSIKLFTEPEQTNQNHQKTILKFSVRRLLQLKSVVWPNSINMINFERNTVFTKCLKFFDNRSDSSRIRNQNFEINKDKICIICLNCCCTLTLKPGFCSAARMHSLYSDNT